MSKRRGYYIEVLIAEMDDLLEDIKAMETRTTERFKNLEISNYVFRANEAVFSREEDAVRRFRERLVALDPSSFPTIENLSASLDAMAKDMVKSLDEPEAVYGFLKRKLDKVLRYVESDDGR